MSERIELPDKLMSDAYVAKRQVDEIVEAYHPRWRAIREMEAHFDGKKPKDPKKLKSLGMSYSSNYNYRKGGSKVRRITNERVDEIISSINQCSVSFRECDTTPDERHLAFLTKASARGIFSEKISKAFIESVLDDSRIIEFINAAEYNSGTWGYCPVLFKNSDWMGRANHVTDVSFPANSTPENLDIWACFKHMTAREVWQAYLKVYNNDSTSYIREGLEELILFLYRGEINAEERDSTKGKERTFGDIFNKFTEKGYRGYVISNTKDIYITKIFNIESNGHLTETWIAYSGECNITVDDDTREYFTPSYLMFQKDHGKENKKYPKIKILRDSGFSKDGYIEQLRGIGVQVFEDGTRHNKKKNAVEDMLLINGRPTFVNSNSQSSERFKMHIGHGFNIVPESARMLESQFNFDIRPQIESLAIDEREFVRDTADFDAKLDGRLSSRPIKSEVEALSAEVARTSTSKNSVRRIDYAQLLLCWINRMVNESFSSDDDGHKAAEMFMCKLRNAFKDFDFSDKEIKDIVNQINSVDFDIAMMNIGAIDELLRTTQEPNARVRLLRARAFALGNSRNTVDEAHPIDESQFTGSKDRYEASIENGLLMSTREIIVEDYQDDVVHMDSHSAKAGRMLQGIEQGGNPLDAVRYLQNMLPHNQQHIESMSRDPLQAGLVKKYQEINKFFAKSLEGLIKRIQEIQARAQEEGARPQQGQQLTFEQQKELREQNFDFRLKELELAQKIERQNVLTQNRKQAMESQQEFKNRMKQQDAEHKRALNESMAQSKVRIDALIKSASLITDG